MHYQGKVMASPLGSLLLLADERGVLRRISFWREKPVSLVSSELESQGHAFTFSETAVAEAERQLSQYFARDRERFDLDLDPEGTDFQRQVWSRLVEIPFGVCRTYKDIAESIDNPKAVRAVGLANGANPIPIVIPCHRVIGANGRLTGFSGGLDLKHDLLKHEGYLLI